MVLSRPLSELPDSARLAPSPVQASQHRSLPLVGWHRKGHSTGQQLQHRVSRADCQELHNYARGKLLSKRQLHRQLKCSAASATPTLPLPAQAPAADKSDTASLKPLPKNVENLADDPSIANPLQRLERLGTGWMGVIMEYDGVLVADTADLHSRAWQQLAQEEGRPTPLHWAIKKAEGMKNEQVIQETFCWSRSPMEVRRLAARKEELYRVLLGDRTPLVPPGVTSLLSILKNNNVPVAVGCSAPEARVRPALRDNDMINTFDAIVTAEDVHRGRPDPECFLYAAQQIQRPPLRCVVVGNSNQTVEAAHEVGMQCVVVAGRTPMYELTAADMVVRQLDELSFINLKQLFRLEHMVGPEEQEELQEEQEEPETRSRTATAVMTRQWD